MKQTTPTTNDLHAKIWQISNQMTPTYEPKHAAINLEH